jgi:hypothetical protein
MIRLFASTTFAQSSACRNLAQRGHRVSLNGDSLALMAATKPSASLLAKLKQHKAEIVAALRLESAARNTLVPPEPDVGRN